MITIYINNTIYNTIFVQLQLSKRHRNKHFAHCRLTYLALLDQINTSVCTTTFNMYTAMTDVHVLLCRLHSLSLLGHCSTERYIAEH